MLPTRLGSNSTKTLKNRNEGFGTGWGTKTHQIKDYKRGVTEGGRREDGDGSTVRVK